MDITEVLTLLLTLVSNFVKNLNFFVKKKVTYMSPLKNHQNIVLF